MNKSLFKKIFIAVLLASILFFPNYVSAVDEIIEGGPKSTFSDQVNQFNNEIGLNPNMTSINSIISTFLPYILSFAGVILLFMLISGGFSLLTGVGNPKAADQGKQRISAALLGFIILFVSYWLIQILEIVLGINILGA